jgi:5-hydroxyisourate hydrolase-like protein (transthyretin family)
VFATFRGSPGYRQVFFPNANDRAQARTLEIAEGTSLSNIDLKLGQPLATFSIKGRVLQTANGSPAAGVKLDLHIEQSRERGVIPEAVTSDANGEFKLDNIPAGHYSLEVSEERRGQKGEFFGASPWFDVREANVSDLEVGVLRTLGVVGRVSVENTNDPKILAKVSEIDLMIELSPDDQGPIMFKVVRANPNLIFSAYGLKPGRLSVYAYTDNQMASLQFRSLRLEANGTPVREVEIGNDKQVADLRVVLVYGSGGVRGRVKLENGALPANARIAVDVKDEKGFVAGDWVDTNGNFLLRAIPPGNYTLNVTAEEPGKRTLGPAAHQTVSVTNDRVTTADISLDLSSLKTP